MIYIILTAVFFFGMLLYFRVANHFNIVDRPNERSSHTELTIRGGGVIYLISALVAGFLYPEYWVFVLSLFTIGVISFVDDRITLSSKIRILFHLGSVSMIFYFLSIFSAFPIWAVIVLYIFLIGIINAYNFMDGINGITGVYSLVVLGGLQYVNHNINFFIEPDIIWLPILASLVFLFFNFRTKAKCFAGDVGSVTIALWVSFLLLKLILQTDNYTYILFLAVYGVDAVLTILHRLALKQNIFEAHRLHFYQILANEKKISHLKISLAYGLTQLLIIIAVIYCSQDVNHVLLMTLVPLSLIYLFFKPRLMGKSLV